MLRTFPETRRKAGRGRGRVDGRRPGLGAAKSGRALGAEALEATEHGRQGEGPEAPGAPEGAVDDGREVRLRERIAKRPVGAAGPGDVESFGAREGDDGESGRELAGPVHQHAAPGLGEGEVEEQEIEALVMDPERGLIEERLDLEMERPGQRLLERALDRAGEPRTVGDEEDADGGVAARGGEARRVRVVRKFRARPHRLLLDRPRCSARQSGRAIGETQPSAGPAHGMSRCLAAFA
jgi:hypothetical protein